MYYTAMTSVVKTSTLFSGHFIFTITQTSVFLDFLRTVSDANWNPKVYKNQCFMKDQLQCGKCQPIYTEAIG